LTASGHPFDEYAHLLELIDFAIRREQEATEFYQNLAVDTQSETVAAELRRLAAMEAGHRSRLERLNVAQVSWKVPDKIADLKIADLKIADLKIADFLVAAEPRPGMSRSELLQIAIGRETASTRLYGDLARMVPDSLFSQLLQNLAAEEVLHRQYLERLQEEQNEEQ
jgi:rubrerythrin